MRSRPSVLTETRGWGTPLPSINPDLIPQKTKKTKVTPHSRFHRLPEVATSPGGFGISEAREVNPPPPLVLFDSAVVPRFGW
jgi:hypothetical protein